MPWRTFLLFEVLGGALWSGVFLGLGLVFSRQIEQVLAVMAAAGTQALFALLGLLAALLAWRFWRRRRALRDAAMPRVGVAELRALLAGEAPPLVVDVRPASSLDIDARRIPGARHVELAAVAALAGELARERDIVVYCNCPNDVSAAQAARVLQEKGFINVRPLAGGLDAWFAAEQGLADVPAAPASAAR